MGDLTHSRTIDLGEAWVTDCVWLPFHERLAVASSDHAVRLQLIHSAAYTQCVPCIECCTFGSICCLCVAECAGLSSCFVQLLLESSAAQLPPLASRYSSQRPSSRGASLYDLLLLCASVLTAGLLLLRHSEALSLRLDSACVRRSRSMTWDSPIRGS